VKKSLFPFCEKVKDYASISFKCWQFSVLLTFFSFLSLSAQEIKHDESVPTAGITIVGDAVIYSKDEAFNEQISKSKNLQQYSKVIKINDDEIKIIAKNSDVRSSTKQNSERAKSEKKLLVSKEKKTTEIPDLPEKEIALKISNGLDGSRFLTGTGSGNISFISPSNDYHSAKHFIIYYENYSRSSLDFLYSTNYFFTNDSCTLQIKLAAFSVRPPPQI
jgi:hypothetical protein